MVIRRIANKAPVIDTTRITARKVSRVDSAKLKIVPALLIPKRNISTKNVPIEKPTKAIIKVCVTNGVMWKPAEKLLMTEEQRTTLKTWVGAKTSPQRTVLRARICLLAADGLSNRSIAQDLKTSRPTVVQCHNLSYLGCARVATAPCERVQALERQAVC